MAYEYEIGKKTKASEHLSGKKRTRIFAAALELSLETLIDNGKGTYHADGPND